MKHGIMKHEKSGIRHTNKPRNPGIWTVSPLNPTPLRFNTPILDLFRAIEQLIPRRGDPWAEGTVA